MKREEIDAFSWKVIYAWLRTMCLDSGMHVMMQGLEGNNTYWPHRLSMLNTYTEMTTGLKQVVVMVKNLTVAPIIIAKGVRITQVIAANAIPQVGVSPGILEKLDKMQGIQTSRMSVEQRKEACFWQLDLSSLGVDHQEVSFCTCPTSWIPWYLFLGSWGDGLHQYG